MLSKNLKSVYQEYFPLYKTTLKSFDPNKLEKLILKSAKEAKANYKKLIPPKTCLANTYIYVWVKQVVDKNLASRSIYKISLENPPPSFKFSTKYFSSLPANLHHELGKRLFATVPERRKEVWESFNLPVKEIEKNSSRWFLNG